MCAFWLKMIGTAENPCPEPYVKPHVDFTKNPRGVKPGDRMILYAVGGAKCVFAIGTAKGPAKPSGVERWPFRVDVEYDVNLVPSHGVPIEAVNLEHHMPAIRFGHSYLSLTREEFELAAMKLRDKAKETRISV
jgi:hypothetical protein